jgi:Gpi18-like mannosyltransferase
MALPSATGSPAASETTVTGESAGRWFRRDLAALTIAFVLGIGIRVVLLPTEGLRGDIDQFVLWIHGIVVDGLPNAYDQNLSFPPVMVYVWSVLAAVQPAFAAITDASDPAIRVLMKLPATLADIGLALVAAYALRAQPRWAVIAAGVILLHPAVIDVSAWWGQYESLYMLPALAAAVLAINGRNSWAAAAITLALMTKPQALPMLVPFATWFWATGGWREVARAAAFGAVVVLLVWLPFLAADGPAKYLQHLADYQGGIFAVLSLRAWNVWWLVQEAAAGGAFVVDNVPVLGPLTLRHVGYLVAGLLETVIAIAVIRTPTPRTLLLALAASVLVAFTFLTSMHERYSYGAVVFLALLIPDLRLRSLGVAFGVVVTLNLLAAVPPTPELAAWLPVTGPYGVICSLGMVLITGAALSALARPLPIGVSSRTPRVVGDHQ